MDTLLHSPSSMAKRPCPSQNPRIQNLNHVDHLLEAFLGLSEFPSLSIDLSLERLLDSSPSDADETLLIDRALKMGSILLEAAKNFSRKRASKHNSLAWPLPPDLTIKVCPLIVYSDWSYASLDSNLNSSQCFYLCKYFLSHVG